MGLFVKTVSGHGLVRVLTSEKLHFFLTMKIFKDVFTGDELFSDTYEIKLIDDVIYEVYGKYETRKEGNIQLEGSNASAEGEDADEGADDPGSQSHRHRPQPQASEHRLRGKEGVHGLPQGLHEE